MSPRSCVDSLAGLSHQNAEQACWSSWHILGVTIWQMQLLPAANYLLQTFTTSPIARFGGRGSRRVESVGHFVTHKAPWKVDIFHLEWRI